MKIIFTSNSLIFYNVIEMIHIYPTYIHSKNLTPYFYSFHWKVCFNWVLFLKYTDRPMKLLSLQIFWLWHNTKSFCWFCGQYLRGRYTMQNYHCNFFLLTSAIDRPIVFWNNTTLGMCLLAIYDHLRNQFYSAKS